MKTVLFKNKNLLMALLVLVATCVGCEDLFEQKADSRITPDVHYTDSVDVGLSLLGAISPLAEVMPGIILMDGLMTDMMDVTTNSDAYMHELNNHQISASNPYINPAGFYKCIINVNEILANVDRVQKTDPTVDDYELETFKGALIGLRSWAYFTISRIYGKAAWIDDNLTKLPSTEQTFIAKEALMDTLINQLKPYLHLNEDIEEFRISKYPNNKALIGEIYLEQERYDSAAHYLKLAIESHGDDKLLYKVAGIYEKENWEYLFIDSDGGNGYEVISVVPFQLTEGQTNPLYSWAFTNYAIQPAQTIMDLFMDQMILKGKIDYRGVGVSVDTTLFNGIPRISKYALGDLEKNDADIIISRAGDIHLLLAEALNRLGESDFALTLVNHGLNSLGKVPREYRNWVNNVGIRGRAYFEAVSYPEEIAEDINAKMLYVEDLIIQERALELAFEGKRWFDLVRVAKRRGDRNYIANKVQPKYSDKSLGNNVGSILKDENNWYIQHP